jgi:hypothetical protein
MFRSAWKKLLKFLQLRLAVWMWVRAFHRTVFPRGTYMLEIRKQGRRMSDDWIYNIIPKDEVERMNDAASKLEYHMSGGISIVLNSDNQSAIDLCRYWREALYGDKNSWVKVGSFMSGIIATIEMHLHEEGIDPYED